MALQIPQDPVPVHINADGVALVGGTRVRLETIVSAFLRGDSPEQIVDDYIGQQDAAAEGVRQTIEANAPEMLSFRAWLLERKAAKKQG